LKFTAIRVDALRHLMAWEGILKVGGSTLLIRLRRHLAVSIVLFETEVKITVNIAADCIVLVPDIS
jgi:hypothetical protein